MDAFTIRLIAMITIFPVVAYFLRKSIQKKKNDELEKIKENQSVDIEKEENSKNISAFENEVVPLKNKRLKKKKVKSKFIDSYNHPNYHISEMANIQMFLLWALLGLFLPFSFLHVILNMQLVFTILIVVILNIFLFMIYTKFINANKNKVLIDLYNDKITFYTKDVFLFEVPQDKIIDLQIIVETDAGTVWPNEYVFIHIEREFLIDKVLPILLKIVKPEHVISFFKIKYKQETIVNLTGEKNTSFIEEIVRLKY